MLHRSIFLTVAFESLDSTEKMQNKKAPALQVLSIGADDGARTRYLHLGKVALYQMSYIRILLVPPGGIEPPTRGFSVPCSTD